MGYGNGLKRVNVYVDPDDLRRVAEQLGCRPSEAIRRLVDNYLLAAEIDEIRRLPGRAPEAVFRQREQYQLADVPDSEPDDLSDDA
jgi:hypothetical protein